jgi:small subunit ribosomal protein S8
VTPASKLRAWVLDVLADEGYIRGYEQTTDAKMAIRSWKSA